MEELFFPSSVVVIGVSTKPFNMAKVIVWNLSTFGFAGAVHLMGRLAGELMGRRIHTSLDEIDQMIDEMPGSETLNGVRGMPPVDRTSLKEALLRIAYLMARFPAIEQIDVNPVLSSSTGAQAVDTRVFLSSGAGS
jgi:hypothetical protein